MILLPSADFFSKNLSGINCLDPDQAQHSFGPDLAPNCLQMSSDDKSCC